MQTGVVNKEKMEEKKFQAKRCSIQETNTTIEFYLQ